MRIGFFTDSYKPYISGVVRSIETFAGELIKRGHKIYIFAPQYPDNRRSETNIYRFPSFRTPFHSEFYLGLPFPWEAKKFIKKWNLEIIHVHSPFLLGSVGAYLARRFGIPLVFTYHTLYDQYIHYFPFARQLVKKVVIKFAKVFCNKCDLVITPTWVIREHLIKHGVRTPIVSVPTGIHYERFSSGDSLFLVKHFSVPSEDKVLLFVGRLGKEKNIYFLINSFSKVLKICPKTTLVLVGSGPEEKDLMSYVKKLDLSSKVIFTGPVSPEIITGVYSSADVFVFPSVTETQGLVILEAMAAGLPVVARAAFGSLAMVNDGLSGYLCDNNESQFAERIIRLLTDDNLRKNMGEKAKKRALLLTADKMALRLEKIYLALSENRYYVIDELANDRI